MRGVPGAASSGRQRRHARNPASSASRVFSKRTTFRRSGVRAGHPGRQKIRVVRTPSTNRPAALASRRRTRSHSSSVRGSRLTLAALRDDGSFIGLPGSGDSCTDKDNPGGNQGASGMLRSISGGGPGGGERPGTCRSRLRCRGRVRVQVHVHVHVQVYGKF